MTALENPIKLKVLGDKIVKRECEKNLKFCFLFFLIDRNGGEVCETEHNSDWDCRRLRDRHLATKRVGFSRQLSPVPTIEIRSGAVRVVVRGLGGQV